MINRDILICKCHSLEHQFGIWYDEEFGDIYCEPHLTTNRNFFQRLLYGLKYAFGYKCRFGAWDEFIFEKEDLRKLIKYIDDEKTGSN